MRTRVRAHVRGIVQGVGFRPYVARLARVHGLAGHVLNSSDGVHLEAEGEDGSIRAFLESLVNQAPHLARIESVSTGELMPSGETGFVIRESRDNADEIVPVSPDVATCADCLREIADPRDRRFLYPFTNCTNCGPRFTIIQGIPYDRSRTTMSTFRMCADCAGEYEAITDRRYHAQPNACPVCGPRAWLEERMESAAIDGVREPDALASRAIGDAGAPAVAIVEAARLLGEGKIGAVKGIGGFHLACDATNEAAVRRLRRMKGREERPLAILVASVEEARRFVEIGPAEGVWLESPERPIVLLERKEEPSPIAASVAPGNRALGVMLPYTPLHTTLMHECGLPALVMTSGNLTEEPLSTDNEEARRRLSRLADFILLHDRPIHIGCDDSVLRVFDGAPLVIRRSRGFAPAPVLLGFPSREVLALGAEIKGSFCLTRDHYGFLSQHIGDLKNGETLAYFERALTHLRGLVRARPEAVAHDLHPDYLSTRLAAELPIARKIPVQHHHAHVAACMAEHGTRGPAIGLAADGVGLGTDGTVWGCEFLRIDTIATFERVAHLARVPMPGGDAATREPWRMAAAYLHLALGDGWPDRRIPFCRTVQTEKWQAVKTMIERRVNSPLCSSAGRLFDAAAALIGLRRVVSYEGQAAIELEQVADAGESRFLPYRFEVREGEPREIVVFAMFEEIVEDLERGVPPAVVARRFHETCALFMAEECGRIARESGTRRVFAGGGTFQNVLLLRLLKARLAERGLDLAWPRLVPPNDGGIALGQAVVASAVLEREG